ncbi:hypothetical protein F4779DRAFT_602141 [Xylariaceae sp. FL0662B]|nr:hypothetical protein F4779DRAFT_602141 [Xylariaceae sp. FL0662B]
MTTTVITRTTTLITFVVNTLASAQNFRYLVILLANDWTALVLAVRIMLHLAKGRRSDHYSPAPLRKFNLAGL